MCALSYLKNSFCWHYLATASIIDSVQHTFPIARHLGLCSCEHLSHYPFVFVDEERPKLRLPDPKNSQNQRNCDSRMAPELLDMELDHHSHRTVVGPEEFFKIIIGAQMKDFWYVNLLISIDTFSHFLHIGISCNFKFSCVKNEK